jgi:hypothetical protein
MRAPAGKFLYTIIAVGLKFFLSRLLYRRLEKVAVKIWIGSQYCQETRFNLEFFKWQPISENP